VVIPVRDRADVVGRAVAAVLAQTFANVEVVVVDRGSSDDTLRAVQAVADRRVRVISARGDAAARAAGVEAARGRWVALLSPDDEVAPGWLARLGRLVDATGAELATCGGEQRHLDGSLTRILPTPLDLPGAEGLRTCFRSGAFIATRRLLLEVGSFGGAHDAPRIDEVGARMVSASLAAGLPVAHTPEPLVRWNEPVQVDERPSGDSLRLRCSLQGIDALARTPIPDGSLLARYAVAGGVAAVRLRQRDQARRLFRLARQLEPGRPRHWARCAAAFVPPVAQRVWRGDEPGPKTTRIAQGAAR
jgi:glycosyltransferase involved in cell wall biosynthesis